MYPGGVIHFYPIREAILLSRESTSISPFLFRDGEKRTKNRPRPRRVFGPINILANILFRRTLKVKHLFYNGKVEPLSVSINTFLNWHFNIYCCVKSSMDLMYEPILQVFKVYFKVMKCYKSVPRSILIYAYE